MKKFEQVAATESNPNWLNMVSRQSYMYERPDDLRGPFERDYTRVLHCNATKRLKHKTQVFFSPSNDHICTRSEHVSLVESISYTIAKNLGLNCELTRAISVAHDLGHPPFGHKGEKILNEISVRDIGETFWHERNGLHFVDDIELLENDKGEFKNLNLTYAVRDGIVSHCGEIDENSVKPRSNTILLEKDYTCPNDFQPYTWEACVVKIADKISYIGRDLEDALELGFLSKANIENLKEILGISSDKALNNSSIISQLVNDLCENSSPENGLCFSKEKLKLIDEIKAFNYKHIYDHPRMAASNEYFKVVINRIYNTLKVTYSEDKDSQFDKLDEIKSFYPKLVTGFEDWLFNYNLYYALTHNRDKCYTNRAVYDCNEHDYCKAIIDFIAGMTDNFAIEIYNEIISF